MRSLSSRLALVGLAIYLLLRLSVSLALAQNISRSNVTLQSQPQATEAVSLVVSVTDKKGAPVKDLPQSAFSITDRKIEQAIVGFDTQDVPLSVALIFDISGSMGSKGRISKRAQSAVVALVRFVRLSHPANEYFLMGFNSKPHLFRESAQEAETTIKVLNHINTLPFTNNTALYDALQVGFNKVSQGTHPKRAIILVTDSGDNDSHSNLRDIRLVLRGTSTLVYPLFLVNKEYGEYRLNSMELDGGSVLEELAEFSGGRLFVTTDKVEMNAFMEQLATELRNQYLISIRPAKAPDKKCNEYKVKLNSASDADKLKSLSARIRKSYCP